MFRLYYYYNFQKPKPIKLKAKMHSNDRSHYDPWKIAYAKLRNKTIIIQLVNYYVYYDMPRIY
jgi:hypothetical protein